MYLDPLKTIPNLTPHCFVKDVLWGSSGYDVISVAPDGKRSLLGSLPVTTEEVGAARSPLVSRLARMGISNVILTPSGTVLAIASRRIWRCAGARNSGVFVKVDSLERGRRPLQRGLCLTERGQIFWGEYFGNGPRDAVRVFGSNDDGASFREALSFPAGAIRHVHAIQQDPYTGEIWILTGDDHHEARIFRAQVHGAKLVQLTSVGGGAQVWRAVSVLFQPDYVYWGTDAPDTRNKIVRYHRRTGRLSLLQEVGGPVYYSALTADGVLCFGTSVENDASPPANAEIWTSTDGSSFGLRGAFPKDPAPVRLFQFGVLNIPSGTHPSGTLCFSATALSLAHETTFLADLSRP